MSKLKSDHPSLLIHIGSIMIFNPFDKRVLPFHSDYKIKAKRFLFNWIWIESKQ